MLWTKLGMGLLGMAGKGLAGSGLLQTLSQGLGSGAPMDRALLDRALGGIGMDRSHRAGMPRVDRA